MLTHETDHHTVAPPFPRARRGRRNALCALSGWLVLGAIATRAETPKAQPGKKTALKPASPAPAPASIRLAYDFKPGETYRYKVSALIKGHIPPLAQAGGPPVNIRVKLEFAANVKKQDIKGTEVSFTVEDADVALLIPGPTGKIDPKDDVSLPVTLEQAQQLFNVTALLKPDGSVASVTGGSNAPLKLDIGIDLRKLFLLTMPLSFPDKALKVNDTWPATDGLLGQKPGKITYANRLLKITPQAKNLTFQIGQTAESLIEDRRDKNGNATEKPADIVDSTTGKATLTGSARFITASGKSGETATVRLAVSVLTLNALLNRKRTIPDPDKPDDPLESKIDVVARFVVEADNKPRKKEKG